ncbi:MAG: cyclic nucleotide-binding domain-containing protein [Candidatus Latescibacteria bacterium]|nr:cyclic nucleotide-binding domain-containing protein [Candidatus Latescibacterota bacterium]
MEFEDRRFGAERRSDLSKALDDRRSGDDRRSVVNDAEKMVAFMKKIPVFTGLTHDQYRRILYICYNKTVPKNLFIYEEGDKADGMYILLKGKVKVLYHKSTVVTHITPIALVGEVEFFTGEPRRTSAVTVEESTIIRVTKSELYRVLQKDYTLSNRILLNVIGELAQKLDKYTEIIQELRSFKDSHIV